jgi:NADPH-dependent 7-cyano-7-deazaguanine reductase QueF
MEAIDNKTRFLAILKNHGITQAQSAVMIAAATQRHCSDRTVRSWLNNSKSGKVRPCPDYAIKGLEFAVAAIQRRMAKPMEVQGSAAPGAAEQQSEHSTTY